MPHLELHLNISSQNVLVPTFKTQFWQRYTANLTEYTFQCRTLQNTALQNTGDLVTGSSFDGLTVTVITVEVRRQRTLNVRWFASDL